MRGAWVIAAACATAAIAACGCAGRSKELPSPSAIPCGFRALRSDQFALSLPLYWQEEAPSKSRRVRGEKSVLVVQGAATGVELTTQAWDGDGKSFARAYAARLKEKGYEHVEHRWTSVGGADALFVEHRIYDSRAKIQWHDWRVLAVGRGLGWQLMCRVDEDDVRTLRPICTQILDSFAVQP